MKSFQQNLLIGLALALCALCAWQWHFQTVQRGQLTTQNQEIYHRDSAIQGYTNSLDKLNQQVARMEKSITGVDAELQKAVQTNRDFIILQKREIARLGSSNDFLLSQIIQCTNDIVTLQSNLDTAYAGIKKQNADVEQLVTNRDFFVGKYTNTVNLYNELAGKYTNLVDRFNKLQAAQVKAPKN